MCPSLKNVDVSDCVSESTYVFVAASSERNSEINIHNANAMLPSMWKPLKN